MKLLKLFGLMFVPMALCATIPQKDIDNATATIEQQALVIEQARLLVDTAIQEYAADNNIENGPTNVNELYTYMATINRYDTTASYAKQIIDILREILERVLMKDPLFFGTFIAPNADSLREAVGTVVQVLTEPIKP